MEKGAEFFSNWTKSQAEFAEGWLKTQKDFFEKWTEATKNLPFMEKGTEAFDAWARPQKDFLDNWSKSQKEFFEKWTEGTKSLQKMLMDASGIKEGTDAFNTCNTLFTTMNDSSKAFAEGMFNMQETWKANLEKQLEMTKEMVKKLSEMFAQKK